jgi:hypothetical protein
VLLANNLILKNEKRLFRQVHEYNERKEDVFNTFARELLRTISMRRKLQNSFTSKLLKVPKYIYINTNKYYKKIKSQYQNFDLTPLEKNTTNF